MRRWLVVLATAMVMATTAQAVVVKVAKDGERWQLLRDGQPYVVKGAGGDGSKAELANLGANSFRTWGADGLEKQLDQAERLGLTVTVGIWLGHKAHGFDWHNATAVAEQKERARRNVLAYREHPALLMWGLGNEMEQGQEEDPVMWAAIEDLAKMVTPLDPNHPTMTVVAELGGKKVETIERLCPTIDILGINTYAGAQSIPERYTKAGGKKPYILTEYGPPGTWEFWKKTPWGAMDEPTSVEKSEWYEKAYTANVVDNARQCLGAYAFTWGSKQEASATWFGLLLPDGCKLNPVDALAKLWSGKAVEDPCPTVEPLVVEGSREVAQGARVKVTLKAADPTKATVKVSWILSGEPANYNTGGATEAAPPTYPDAIVKADESGAELVMPGPGRYRLFAYVRNGRGSAAMANIALNVKPRAVASDPTKSLPFIGEEGQKALWYASGYMGNNGAVTVDEKSTVQPHGGQTCVKCRYGASDGWAGVVWQSPANDWGDKPGGWDLTGASRLSFWARGDEGGEVVSFSFGLLKDTKFRDSGRGELKDVKLTKEWKQYSIDLAGRDLSQIKTGFCWVVAGQGKPVTFYLDDVSYDGIAEAVAPAPPPAMAQAPKGELPLAVYDEPNDKLPWVPSGYMGNNGAVSMTADCPDQPHAGKTCLKVDYKATDGWAGVVWQSPANDWDGNQPGGWNLTGAKALTFWARGAKGGEVVSFSFGLVAKAARYADSAKGELKDAKLTTDWQQFRIDLAGKDLSQVKTGFCWVVAGRGEPVTFYLDDVRWE